jgi:hypothetical protein
MQTSHAVEQSGAPPAAGRFSPVAFLLALAAGPVVGLVWAWAADMSTVQFGVSHFLLFPAVVGVFVGLTVIGLARVAEIGYRPTVLVAAVLAALVAAGGQHYLHYLWRYWRSVPPVSAATDAGLPAGNLLEKELVAEGLKKIPKIGFGEYMAAQARRGRPLIFGYVAVGWAAWLSWTIDAMLTVAAALAVTMPGVRVPYCGRCRSWYRTIRNGRIDPRTAQSLGEVCGVEEIGEFRSPRYRLSCCKGGCGPTRCELSWEEAGGVDLVRVWLDSQQRRRVVEILDSAAEATDEQSEE